jgi:hypothetical protein
MYDTIYNDQFPSGAQAYAGYVDGSIGNQPNYNYIVSTFPKASHLSISLDGSVNADVLDVEQYAAVPSDVPGWYSRQKARGIQRPCVYANVSTMQGSILPVIDQAKISRSSVRLWTAHYDYGQHICGPGSCRLLSLDADGTQWTSNALGRVLDESELVENFFTTVQGVPVEAELQSGQLNLGKNAPTAISVAPGSAHQIAFGCDNSVENQPPAVLRVAIHDTGWYVTANVAVEGSNGLHVIAFRNAAKTGVISVIRQDAGTFPVGYVVY